MGLYGMGELTSLVTLCELGDVAPERVAQGRADGRHRQRPSGRSHSTRNDPSAITSPTTLSRTQISPGIHGDQRQTTHHNHSPPPLRQTQVQISSTLPRRRLGAWFSSGAGVS